MLRIFTLYFLASVILPSSWSLCHVFCQCREEEILCPDKGLTYIPQISTTSTPKHLGLAGNSISVFGPQEFLQYSNLSHLDLRFNLISCIHHGSFASLSGLIELHLGNNRISVLKRQAFCGLTKLMYLDLHGNQLRDIKLGTFHSLTHLRILRLSGNALTFLPQGIFVGLGSLETLYLEDNQIRSVFRDTFKGLGHLHELHLSGTLLSCFPHSALKPLSSLSDLHLNDVIMQMKSTHLKSQLELKAMSFSKNLLSMIDLHTFYRLSKLELLKLNKNGILKIDKHSFCHCAHIREIHLSDSLISTIEDSAFVGSHIKVLKLNWNRLSLRLFSPRTLQGRSQLSLFNLNENPWDCGRRILCLKRWLESGNNRLLCVSVRCSQPETLRGRNLGAISSAFMQSSDRMCSDALPLVNCGTTAITYRTWLSEPKVVNIEDMQMRRGEDRPASKVLIKNAYKRDISEHIQSGVGVLPTGRKMTGSIPTRIPTSTKDVTVNAPCIYNHEIINISLRSVTSTSAVIEWSLARTDSYDVYFRVMYDQFNTRGRFSRFINVKHGTVCDLCDLRPSTPYLVCVESVVQELVCHVASRDLCLGIITNAEPLSGPEPQTITLYFSAINTVAILTVLVLIGCVSFMIRRHWSSALSLVFSQKRSISCAMCAGIPMSDHNSGIQTNSSQTGTYQPNDMDAIDLPPAN